MGLVLMGLSLKKNILFCVTDLLCAKGAGAVSKCERVHLRGNIACSEMSQQVHVKDTICVLFVYVCHNIASLFSSYYFIHKLFKNIWQTDCEPQLTTPRCKRPTGSLFCVQCYWLVNKNIQSICLLVNIY